MTAPAGLCELVEATLADPLAAARAHAAAGGRVVGVWTANVPPELVLAAGAFPLQLPHAATAATPRTDAWFEPLFDRALRSAIESWLAGSLDFVDAVVLPRSLDSAQRAWYYLDELRRTGELAHGPRPLLYDLQKVPRASSAAYTVAATARLARQLGAEPAAMPAAIARVNARRRAFAALAERAAAGALPDPGFAERVLRAAGAAEPAAFDAALERWLAAGTATAPSTGTTGASGDAASAPGSGTGQPRRIALVGSVPPDDRLHRAIAAGGGCVVAERHLMDARRHGPELLADGDPVGALGRHYHAHVATVRDFGRSPADVLATTPAPDGLVLWLAEEDEALVWQVPALLRAAAAAGVPVHAATRQDWLAPPAALAAITGFVAASSPR